MNEIPASAPFTPCGQLAKARPQMVLDGSWQGQTRKPKIRGTMYLQLSHIITTCTCTHNYLHISYLFVNCMCDPDHPGCARCKWLCVRTMIEADPTVAWTLSNTHIYIMYIFLQGETNLDTCRTCPNLCM
jgi:hypothetical protein